MKKLIVILFVTFLATGAFAQKSFHGGGVRIIAPRPAIGFGLYSPFYYGYSPFWRYPYGYGYYNNGYYHRPTKLDLQIADIKNDYQQKISAAKDDKSISKAERRQAVRDLKHDCDQAIIEAKRDYYKAR